MRRRRFYEINSFPLLILSHVFVPDSPFRFPPVFSFLFLIIFLSSFFSFGFEMHIMTFVQDRFNEGDAYKWFDCNQIS